jgi:hypothetical protein
MYLLQVDEQLLPHGQLIRIITEDLDFLFLLSVMAGLLALAVLTIKARSWRG